MTLGLGPARSSWLGWTAIALAVLAFSPSDSALGQTKVLMYGSGAGPVDLADPAAFDHLVSRFGEENVTYLQATGGNNAAEANGFDVVVLSSTFTSGNMLVYGGIAAPVLNWEPFLLRNDRAGEFFMAEDGNATCCGAEPLDMQTSIDIVADHFITAGLPMGLLEVTTEPDVYSYAVGPLAPGVQVLANHATVPEWPVITVVEEGGELLGSGAAGMPATAPARRVNFFAQDNTFNFINDAGLQLFDRSLDWLLGREGFAGDVNDNGVVNRDDFDILSANFGNTDVERADGDLNFNGEVELLDFRQWKANDGNVKPAALGAGVAVPEPTSLAIAALGILAATLFQWRRQADRRTLALAPVRMRRE